jgi:hypothetical protein
VAKMTAKRRSVCKVMDMMMSDSGSSLNAGFVGATGRYDFPISLCRGRLEWSLYSRQLRFSSRRVM